MLNPTDLIQCKFCLRGPHARSTNEPWETQYATARPWKEGERNAFYGMRRMYVANRSTADFFRTADFGTLLAIYPPRLRSVQQPSDAASRSSLADAIQERDTARRERDIAFRERDSALQERDAMRRELDDFKESLRSLLNRSSLIGRDRSRSPRRF